jgi:DNA-binding NtrC family response regulator
MADILLIDSYPRIRELLNEEFASEGYRFVRSGDLQSVNKEIKFNKPDLVLLDLYLNGQVRWDVLADIKLHYPEIPILIFTAYAGYKRDPRVSQSDGFILKDVFLDTLKQKIETVLENQSACESGSEEMPISCIQSDQ